MPKVSEERRRETMQKDYLGLTDTPGRQLIPCLVYITTYCQSHGHRIDLRRMPIPFCSSWTVCPLRIYCRMSFINSLASLPSIAVATKASRLPVYISANRATLPFAQTAILACTSHFPPLSSPRSLPTRHLCQKPPPQSGMWWPTLARPTEIK